MGLVMWTWVRGTRLLFEKTRKSEIPLDFLADTLSKKPPTLVPGTAVFLTSDPQSTPTALMHSLKHYKVLHEQNVVLSVVTVKEPTAPESERVKMEPDHVYVIPPTKNLSSLDGFIEVIPRAPSGQNRAPIDLFFRTLADTHGTSAAGIVLSGTGSDGALGLRRIKEAGGVAMAQHPDEAEHGSMPSAAIGTGIVDRVLPAAELGPELVRLFSTEPRIEERALALGDRHAMTFVDVEMAHPLGHALDGGAPRGTPRKLVDRGAHRFVERVVDQRDARPEGIEDPRRREGLARTEHGPRLDERTPRDPLRRLAEGHDAVAEGPRDGTAPRPVRGDADRRRDRANRRRSPGIP